MTDLKMLERAKHTIDNLTNDLEALCGAENPYIAEMSLSVIPKISEVRNILERYMNTEYYIIARKGE